MTKSKKESSKLEKIKELEAGWQRTQADFANYCKRTETEKQENLAHAKAEFIAKITPVLDNFSRAFTHLLPKEKNDPIVLGFRQIEKQLQDILAYEGLEKISAKKGEKFEPARHEAISCEENVLPADQIIAEVESGWQFGNRVIKPAKVRVSKGK